MKLYIENLVDAKIEIEELSHKEPFRYYIKIIHNANDCSDKASFCASTNPPIILDENGEDYIVVFYVLKNNYEIGKFFHSWSNVVRINKEQAKIFNNLNGFLAKDLVFFENHKIEKSNALKKIEEILEPLNNYFDIFQKYHFFGANFSNNSYAFCEKIVIK